MSKKTKKEENKEQRADLRIDFRSLAMPKTKPEEEYSFEITETAANLANQLVIDYQRLAQNEDSITASLGNLLGAFNSVLRDSKLRSQLEASNNLGNLIGLSSAFKLLVDSLLRSKKQTKILLDVMKDIQDGHRFIIS